MVEAIAEDPRAKADAAGRARRRRAGAGRDPRHHHLLAARSSELAAASGRPERFVGLHVFNPVPKMTLVELAFPRGGHARRPASAPRALCEALGKTAVEVPDMPGFVVNRLLFPYLFDAVRAAGGDRPGRPRPSTPA